MQSSEFPTWQRAVQDLLEAHHRSEQRLSRLETAMAELAESQRRMQDALGALAERQQRTEESLTALAERQQRTEESLTALAERQQRTEESLTALAESQQRMQDALGALAQQHRRMDDRLGSVRGYVLELRYPEKAAAYFSLLLTRVDVVKAITLEDTLEKKLNPEEVQQVLLLDCLLRGRTRHRTEPREVWLAIEISATVYPHDVERAALRAGLLQRAGYPAIPVATGEGVTPEAEALAQDDHVVLALDGTISFWQDALQTWTA